MCVDMGGGGLHFRERRFSKRGLFWQFAFDQVAQVV